MTSDEAKQALKEGKKIGLKDWKNSCYFRLTPSGALTDEIAITYDYNVIFENHKDDEWEIVE